MVKREQREGESPWKQIQKDEGRWEGGVGRWVMGGLMKMRGDGKAGWAVGDGGTDEDEGRWEGRVGTWVTGD